MRIAGPILARKSEQIWWPRPSDPVWTMTHLSLPQAVGPSDGVVGDLLDGLYLKEMAARAEAPVLEPVSGIEPLTIRLQGGL